MKQLIHRIFFITAWSFISVITHATHAPRLTVILVIDQLPYHIVEQLRPNLSGGLKYLLRHGINYSHAYMPHALPATATGHAALNTGTFAKDHGIVANAWYDAQGNKIAADDDFSENAYVFDSEKHQEA
jgi:predicted AlkP superfamily pyrophosphatase or phosphodiesterase